ncbi:hypothetical protein E2C01_084565 [Portunus trituberculatus]|nr:hypothetical protein [Portunus trituberculatus]
MTWWSL